MVLFSCFFFIDFQKWEQSLLIDNFENELSLEVEEQQISVTTINQLIYNENSQQSYYRLNQH